MLRVTRTVSQQIILALSSCLLAGFAHLSIVFLAFKPPTTSPLSCEEDWTSQNVTFDTSVMSRTIVTEFRLVCDRAAFLPLLTFSYMLAIALTNIFAGGKCSENEEGEGDSSEILMYDGNEKKWRKVEDLCSLHARRGSGAGGDRRSLHL